MIRLDRIHLSNLSLLVLSVQILALLHLLFECRKVIFSIMFLNIFNITHHFVFFQKIIIFVAY